MYLSVAKNFFTKYGILDITIYAMHYILFCPWELLVHSSLSLPTTYSCHNSSGHSAIKPSLLSSFTTSPNLHPFHYYYQIQFNLLKFFLSYKLESHHIHAHLA